MLNVVKNCTGGLANGVMVLAALPRKEEADLAFLGPHLPDDIAQAIAEGALPRRCMLGSLKTWESSRRGQLLFPACTVAPADSTTWSPKPAGCTWRAVNMRSDSECDSVI